jgi:hypothetical protein
MVPGEGFEPPKGERPIYWDALMPGLTDTGRKTFVVMHRVAGGKLVNHAIGIYPAWTLKEARDEARKVLLTLADGKTPRQVEADRRGWTFGEVAEDYIRWHVPTLKTEKDRREVEARVRDRMIKRWSDRPIAEIRNRDVVRMAREVIAAGGNDPEPGTRRRAGGPNTARHALATARHLFNWAVEQDAYAILRGRSSGCSS